MYSQIEKIKENNIVDNFYGQKNSDKEQRFKFINNRPEAITQRKLQKIADNSQRVKQYSQSNLTINKKKIPNPNKTKVVPTDIIQRRPWEKNSSYGVPAYIDKERQWLFLPGNSMLYNLFEDDEVIETLSQEREEEIKVEIKQDAHVEAMEGMMHDDLKWNNPAIPKMKNTNIEKRKPFTTWLYHNGPAPSTMNCWEAVLYGAFLSGLIDKEYINNAIQPSKSKDGIVFVKAVIANKVSELTGNGHEIIKIDNEIPRGHIVIFGPDGQHVALSTGCMKNNEEQGVIDKIGEKGHEIIELDNPTSGVQYSTAEDVMARNMAYSRKITWGPFPSNF